jgi:hypothetical protein
VSLLPAQNGDSPDEKQDPDHEHNDNDDRKGILPHEPVKISFSLGYHPVHRFQLKALDSEACVLGDGIRITNPMPILMMMGEFKGRCG